MNRWLVIFSSHPEPPADMTFVDVRARNFLEAIVRARREQPPPHGWSLVSAYAWPMGCEGVDEATRKIAGARR